MTNELVSIITPMYKGADFVADAIRSVQKQNYNNWEMIIVDDCSPDDKAGIKVVRQFANADPRIKLIESTVNRGSSGARNIALQNAHGRFIAFLDSDDIWHPSFLQKQLKLMEEKNAEFVFSSYRRIDEQTKEEILRPFIVPRTLTYRQDLVANPVFPSTMIYDSSKIEKIYFNEELGSMRDDYVYILAILKQIPHAYGNPEILVDYRIRKSSVTGNKWKVIKPQWNVLYKIEKIGLIRSCINITRWAWISYFKYRK